MTEGLMKKQIPVYRRVWAPLLVVIMLSLISVEDATAQAREQTRGRTSGERVERKQTSERSQSGKRVERQKNDKKATRAGTRSNRSSAPTNRTEARRNRTTSRSNRADARASRTQSRANRDESRTASRSNRQATRQGTATTSRAGQTNRGTSRSGVHVRDGARGNRSTVNREPVRNRRNRVQPQSRVRVARDKHRSRYYKRYHHTRPDVYRHYQRPKIYFHHRRPNVYVNIDIRWPWKRRYQAGWAPRYVYKQVVYAEADWGHRTPWYRDAELDVRTHYRQEVRYANDRYAEIDIHIEAIELYEDGYFLGEVRRIPNSLGRVRAKVYRNGRVTFNRDMFLLGDSYSGFEMISTRHYEGYILDAYHRSHGYRVGKVDLYQERVVKKRRSRLFNPHDFNGFVPISLLPENTDWLIDAGLGAVTAHYYGDDPDYFYGGSDDYYDDYSYRAAPQADKRVSTLPRAVPRTSTNGTNASAPAPKVVPRQGTRGGEAAQNATPLRLEDDQAFKTQSGATIRLKRQTEISRVQ